MDHGEIIYSGFRGNAQLPSMKREQPMMSMFKFIRVNRAAILRHFCEK